MNTRTLVRRNPRSQLVQPVQTASPEDAGRRWRPVLERSWDRKLDEAIALTAACEGMSAAGEELPAGDAMAPYRQLHARAALALDELGELVDALMRIDGGSYGRCDGCGRPMADDWLARDPAARRCRDCLTARVSVSRPGDDPARGTRQARHDRSHYGHA